MQFGTRVRAHIQVVHVGLREEWVLVIVEAQVRNLWGGQAARRPQVDLQVRVCRQNSLCLGDPSLFS